MKRFYVTMNWEDNSGSYGDVIEASTEDDAIDLCKRAMAESRAAAGVYTAEEALTEMGDDWETVDCFDLDEFIEHHERKPSRAKLIAALADNQSKWLDEEDSVQEEKADLIEANRQLLDECGTGQTVTMQLFAVESGIRGGPGESNDRDIYAVATDKAEAIALWREYYEMEEDDEAPDRVWLLPIPVEGPARVFEWGGETAKHIREV